MPGLASTTVAVLIGAIGANLGLHRVALHPGTSFAARRLLRAGVVLLGLQLSITQLAHLGLGGLAVVVTTVTITFFGTQGLGRLLGVGRARSLLVATGFSICGASAVGAMKEVAGGDEEDAGRRDRPGDAVRVAGDPRRCPRCVVCSGSTSRRSGPGSGRACTTWVRPSPRRAACPGR